MTSLYSEQFVFAKCLLQRKINTIENSLINWMARCILCMFLKYCMEYISYVIDDNSWKQEDKSVSLRKKRQVYLFFQYFNFYRS